MRLNNVAFEDDNKHCKTGCILPPGTVGPRLPMRLMVRNSLRIIVQVPSQYACHNGVVLEGHQEDRKYFKSSMNERIDDQASQMIGTSRILDRRYDGRGKNLRPQHQAEQVIQNIGACRTCEREWV